MKPFVFISGPYRAETINGIAENIAEAEQIGVKIYKSIDLLIKEIMWEKR